MCIIGKAFCSHSTQYQYSVSTVAYLEPYHEILSPHPAVHWKVLQHGHKVLNAAIPVA